ncbi:hypothetical protein HPP92_026104 [Vanilla planifolia]|uniref:Uncharacterized protein n=1 Tax=Vanilla planifolia TaxID=51239 RepID=A0A835UAG0_VANPL|nr:hypothetical protein HPP92_026104 [Vanilla planifolia]
MGWAIAVTNQRNAFLVASTAGSCLGPASREREGLWRSGRGRKDATVRNLKGVRRAGEVQPAARRRRRSCSGVLDVGRRDEGGNHRVCTSRVQHRRWRTVAGESSGRSGGRVVDLGALQLLSLLLVSVLVATEGL